MKAKYYSKCKSSKTKKGKKKKKRIWGGNIAVVKDAALRQEHCSILKLSLLLSLEHLFKYLLSPHYVYVSLHLHELKGANSYHQEGIWGSRQSEQSFTKLLPLVVISSSEEGTKSLHVAPEREQPMVLGRGKFNN